MSVSQHHPAVRMGAQLTRGERAADRMKAILATWVALIVVVFFIVLWIVVNSHLTGSGHKFDPVPWIMLNLCLSMFAALQCFVLLIANRRGEQIAAEIAIHTERNTEELKTLLEKNTALTEEVKTNTDLLEEIHRHVTTLAPDAGTMDPEPAPKPKVARPRKKKII